jgi:hypothetical protein
MRTLNRQPKVKVDMPIPAEFASFLSAVHELIVKEDECATLESDDLLQCESAYGGLIKKGGSEYSFVFFPEEGIRVKWEVELSTTEIQQVANKELSSLVLWQCKDPECRCAFSSTKESCFYCDWKDDQK